MNLLCIRVALVIAFLGALGCAFSQKVLDIKRVREYAQYTNDPINLRSTRIVKRQTPLQNGATATVSSRFGKKNLIRAEKLTSYFCTCFIRRISIVFCSRSLSVAVRDWCFFHVQPFTIIGVTLTYFYSCA